MSTSGRTIQTVEKTVVYLPSELKRRISAAARSLGLSENEVIRRAVDRSLGPPRPRPRPGIIRSGHPIAGRADELLAGFGEG